MTEPTREDIFGLGGVASQARDTEIESQWLRQHFKLPYNPFPPSGISPDAPEGPPLKDEQGQEIGPQVGRFIMSAYRDRASTQGLVIIGAYGTGKSHLLRLIHNQINEWLGSGDEKALSIYVQRPRVEAQDVNREILRSLGEDTIRKMLWYCMQREIAKDSENQSEALAKLRVELEGPIFAPKERESSNRVARIFAIDNLQDYRKFLGAYDAHGWPRERLRDYFTELFTRSLETQSPLEVIEAYVALLLAPDEKSRATWESLLALGKRRKVPLMAAPEFLQDLLSLTRINGYVYTFLLVDEFEEVPSGYLLTRRQKANYMYTLMEMLNKVQVGLGLVLAITPEAWEALTSQAPPLQDRLPTVIHLGTLNADSIGRLMRFYLGRARQDADLEADDPLFPFSERLIDEIANKMPARTPRSVLQFTYQVISHCVVHDITTITSETTQTVLGNFLAMKAGETQKRRLGRR